MPGGVALAKNGGTSGCEHAAPANALGLGAFFDAVAGEVIATAAASLTPHIFIVRRPPEVDRSRIDLIARDRLVDFTFI